MSFRHEGLTCSVCRAYLFEDDDVVYCPECGAPHHRDCYNSIGHCGLADKHGTAEQYDILKEQEQQEQEQQEKEQEAKKAEAGQSQIEAYSRRSNNNINDRSFCENCGQNYPSIMNRCPRCGTPNSDKEGSAGSPGFGGFNLSGFDFLGGVPADMDLGRGVTADEAKRFVISNTHRYIPKFASMLSGAKASWNWLAFLFPPVWFMSRKMYKQGILTGVLMIALTILTFPFLNSVAYLDTSSARNYLELAQLITESLSDIGMAAFILASVGSVLNLILRIFTGIFADYSYRNHTINTVADIKSNTDDIETDFRKKGGTSLLGLLIGFFAVEYLPTIIAMFL